MPVCRRCLQQDARRGRVHFHGHGGVVQGSPAKRAKQVVATTTTTTTTATITTTAAAAAVLPAKNVLHVQGLPALRRPHHDLKSVLTFAESKQNENLTCADLENGSRANLARHGGGVDGSLPLEALKVDWLRGM